MQNRKEILKFRPVFLTAVTAAYSATTCAMIITQLPVCRIGMNAQPVNRTSVATVKGEKSGVQLNFDSFPTANTTAYETDHTHHRKANAV